MAKFPGNLRYFVVTLHNLEPVFFLDQTCQINGHFGYIDGINRTKGPFVMSMGNIGVPTKEARQRHKLYFYFCVLCHACKVEICSSLFTMALASDNSIVCFRRKAFLKSDMLAGFTTSVALICPLACVISWKFDFYSNLFEFGTLHFHWLLARWDASIPHIPERSWNCPYAKHARKHRYKMGRIIIFNSLHSLFQFYAKSANLSQFFFSFGRFHMLSLFKMIP